MKNPDYEPIVANYRRNLRDDFLKAKPIYLSTVDGLHPNALGNRIIAEEMARLIILDYPELAK